MNARVKQSVPLVVLFSFAIFLLSCGNGGVFCFFNSVNVSATASSTADHSAIAPGNQVHFVAFGSGLTAGCVAAQSNLMNVTWSVSDAPNVTISNAKDTTFGVATCVNASNGPVTVTATLPSDLNNGTTAKGTSTMTCK